MLKKLLERDWFLDGKGDKDWAIRRRIVIWILLWSVAEITYLTVFGKPDSLRETIATNIILLMGGVIGSYVFGVVWDTKNKATTETAQTAIEQSDSVNVQTKVELP
ncbi:hypothetical protein ACP46_gp40 [Rhizobium phage RHEph06]|uniref:Uncharacterized protein n=4 Tax=Kleczkowskavirus RHEph4 TaxID=1921526 RepID=A0A7S5R8T7_9CAUD|nr:hypothetical protein ACP46_gp40 [Rhizobium phage RHEph06]YP_009598481.1 hypothetical protein FDH25_gp39 [Rhizobium phage RHEph04]AGC35801.1 hypothetical protein RHEph05_gp034 [Rhizobium phage RHEph05]QIG67664.1 hypothetical protein EVB51_047 [Rhizobium phage RHph_Y17]QIG68983.1 hypothetical protein EVB73_047 [Rhizobium phage RHph_Y3_43]QXV74918.1 hypothetical protein [Rhizobium phage RHEph26]AGC35725.1 hypothetical protein RHEph04_gp039 [Rhizobium phage RHEph04]